MPPGSTQDEESDSQRIVRLLGEDKQLVLQRFQSDIARYHAISGHTCEVRSQAHELVMDVSEQGLTRHRAEERLFIAHEHVHAEFTAVDVAEQPKWSYLQFSRNSTKPTLSIAGRGRGYDGRWDSWVRESGLWAEIDAAQNELLVAAQLSSDQREEARSAAQRAIWQMDATVRQARDWSATFFGEPARNKRGAATPSAIPLIAFLVVAFIGIWLDPDPHAGWIAAGLLVLAVLASALRLRTRPDHGAAAIAAFAAGSAFALFTAAYLVARSIEPDSLQRTSALTSPIGSIAEAAFASLTVGVTGATIGIELDGAGA